MNASNTAAITPCETDIAGQYGLQNYLHLIGLMLRQGKGEVSIYLGDPRPN